MVLWNIKYIERKREEGEKKGIKGKRIGGNL
jgi:hypothetical protein